LSGKKIRRKTNKDVHRCSCLKKKKEPQIRKKGGVEVRRKSKAYIVPQMNVVNPSRGKILHSCGTEWFRERKIRVLSPRQRKEKGTRSSISHLKKKKSKRKKEAPHSVSLGREARRKKKNRGPLKGVALAQGVSLKWAETKC